MLVARHLSRQEKMKNHEVSLSSPPEMELEEVVEMIPIGFMHYRLLAMCGLCFMADALEVNLLSYISQCAGDEWNLTNVEISSIAGVVFLGILVGNLIFGVLADHWGRRLTFLISAFMISLFGFLSGTAFNYQSLIAFRTIAGVGIGGGSVPFDLLSEFMPVSQRGTGRSTV